MPQHLKVLAATAEDLSSGPSTPIGQPTTAYEGSNAVSWPPWTPLK